MRSPQDYYDLRTGEVIRMIITLLKSLQPQAYRVSYIVNDLGTVIFVIAEINDLGVQTNVLFSRAVPLDRGPDGHYRRSEEEALVFVRELVEKNVRDLRSNYDFLDRYDAMRTVLKELSEGSADPRTAETSR